jgi:hypothetical protein
MRDAGCSRVRRRGRTAVGWWLVLFAGSQVVFAGMLETGAGGLRDPEYYDRLARVEARRAERPGRPVMVALGSSRVAMGFRPAVLADRPGEAVAVNFGLTGGGPLAAGLTLDRLVRDGARPDAVVVEYWPPYFTPALGEVDRLDVNRLNRADLAAVSLVLPDPAAVGRRWSEAKWTPTASHRRILVSRLVPPWLPWDRREDAHRDTADGWGWRSSADGPERPDRRAARLAVVRDHFAPRIAAGGPWPPAAQALNGLLDLCHREGIPAAVVWLPEASEFRALYPPDVERWATTLFADVGTRPGVRRVDARAWVADGELLDGFHLTPTGAAAFTTRLRQEAWP